MFFYHDPNQLSAALTINAINDTCKIKYGYVVKFKKASLYQLVQIKKHGSKISLNKNTKNNLVKLINLVIIETAPVHKFARNLGANSKF